MHMGLRFSGTRGFLCFCMGRSIAVFEPIPSPFGIARLNSFAVISYIFLSVYFRIYAVFP